MAESVRLAVTRLARILRQLNDDDLTPSRGSALATIIVRGPLALGELAALEHVSAPTITRIVETLQRDGLVTRRVSAADGRITQVEATDKGRVLIDENRSRRRQWLAEHLDQLTQDDLAALEAAIPVLERLIATASEQAHAG